MKKTSVNFIFITSLVTCLIACSRTGGKSVHIDEFYTEKGEWDSARLPLIKPYEAIITSKEFGWMVNLEGGDGDTGLQNTAKVAVKDGVIFLYNTNSILHGIDVKQSWHLIIPGKHIEKGFATHQEYLKYLNKMGIKKEPHLYDVELVADYFENHDVIDWDAIGKP